MADYHTRGKNNKFVVTCLASLFAINVASTAMAQSTPTELADWSLEDLIDIDLKKGFDDGNSLVDSKWEFGYTFRRVNFGGYKNGTQDLSFDDVLASPGETRTSSNFPVVPTYITQNVHALSAAHHVTDSITLSMLVPIISQETEHISSVPGFDEFTLKTDGIGDIAVNASFQHQMSKKDVFKTSLGLRLPTGSIDQTGDTPRNGTGTDERLPYTMQLGSGTYDFALSLKYVRSGTDFNYGGGLNSTVRTGQNDNNYRLADSHNVGIWSQYTKNFRFKPGVRVNYRYSSHIKGRDDALLVPGPFIYPASITDPENYGHNKISATAYITSCLVKDCKVSFTGSFSKPLYQKLNGIQPKEKNNFAFGTSIKF